MKDVYIYMINASEATEALDYLLDIGTIKHIDRYLDEKKKRESRAGYLLLSYGVKKVLPSVNAPIPFTWSKEGKPEFMNLKLSSAHSSGYTCVCVGVKEIGIDIEKIKEVTPSLKRKVIHKDNQIDYENSNDKNKLLIKYWTIKEAYYKCKGKVKPSSSETLKINKIKENRYIVAEDCVAEIIEVDGFFIALVEDMDSKIIDREIEMIKIEDIVHELSQS